MKKLLKLLFGSLLFLPYFVFADMSGPMIRIYKATPKNPEGADIYKYDLKSEAYIKTGEKFAYGKVVEIDYDNEYICIDDECSGEVKLDDLVAIDDKYEINEKELSDEYDAIILKDQVIKTGPAYAYKSTNVTIKAGTKVKLRDLATLDEETKELLFDEYQPWKYIEYNGTKGFIIAYKETVGYDGKEVKAITDNKVKIINPVNNKVIDTIKANTNIKTITYTLEIWSNYYYIEYNGKKGLVSKDKYLTEDKSIKFETTDNLKLYKSIEFDENDNVLSKSIGNVPKGTKSSSSYYIIENYCIYFRYDDNNLHGWIYANYDESEEAETDYVGLIVDYPWNDDEENDDDIEVPEEVNPVIPTDKKPYISLPVSKKDKMNTIYICIGVSLVTALTAVVTILLVNKKKKKREDK